MRFLLSEKENTPKTCNFTFFLNIFVAHSRNFFCGATLIQRYISTSPPDQETIMGFHAQKKSKNSKATKSSITCANRRNSSGLHELIQNLTCETKFLFFAFDMASKSEVRKWMEMIISLRKRSLNKSIEESVTFFSTNQRSKHLICSIPLSTKKRLRTILY